MTFLNCPNYDISKLPWQVFTNRCFTKIVAVFSEGGYKVQGLQNPQQDFIGQIYKISAEFTTVTVKAKEAYDMSRKIAIKEGLLLGMSSGAALYVSRQIAKKINHGNIVAVSPDRGEKYLSTALF